MTGTGTQKFAHCPLHKDDNPSVSVRDNRGSWRCFSCSAKGDAITLVGAVENLDFMDSMKWLIEEFSIQPPERLYKNEKRAMIKRLESEGKHDEAFKILMEDK